MKISAANFKLRASMPRRADSNYLSLLRGFLQFAALLHGVCVCESAAQAPYVGCGVSDPFFRDEVWAKVAALSCIDCHKAGSDAEHSDFILLDPTREAARGEVEILRYNRGAFARMAAMRSGDGSRLLLKATGRLAHEGEAVLKADSTGYGILAEFVRRVDAADAGAPPEVAEEPDAPPFFEGIAMLDERRLLRRVTLSLAARLPTAEENEAVKNGGLDAISPLLDAVMKEDAFYERLAEAFNDIFLVRGYADGAETALSYDHFSETRHWTQKYDLDHIVDEDERRKARYKLADDYREALLREPLELIKYIVRNGRPFSEIVTADYIMVSPYTSRGYGIHHAIRGRFKDPDDPFEYIPVRLNSLKHRDDRNHQESATGYYPHAGMLTIFQYLRRYPTTETNRNRLRARMFYQHFLGVDVLELAARVSDAAAASAKYKVPTMEAPECVICHRTLDPVAGLYQDYYSFEGVFGPRKEGWYEDIFDAGFEGEKLPPEQRWRALQWLGERTASDPRFAATMVEHVYYILTGRGTLLPPKDIDDPLFAAKQRAYHAQRKEIGRIAERFVQANFDLKGVFKDWIVSEFYRADGLLIVSSDPGRAAELEDIGLARMLGPEQLERKVAAIFGKPWGRLQESEYAILYGGIDSNEVTERATDPGGAMGAIQRTLANDVACNNVGVDFATEASARRLFPGIEPDVLPGSSPEADSRIRQAIVHLHQLVLGRDDDADSPEVAITYDLFAGIVDEARERKGVEPLESYFCRAEGETRIKDPHYTIRAWRAVVTYLLRQREFLYE